MKKQFFFSWRVPLFNSQKNGDVAARKLFDLTGQTEVAHGFSSQKIHFRGFISNQSELQTKFEQSATNLDELLLLAIKYWGDEVNQYVLGDYVLVWLQDNQLTITCSAYSSHTVFYRYLSNNLNITSELSQIVESGAVLNEALLLQRYSFGLLLNSETCFNNILQLLPGETISWQKQAKVDRVYQQRLDPKLQQRLSKQVILPAAKQLNLKNCNSINSEAVFNSLPQLAFKLTEPVVDASLVEFSQCLAGVISSSDDEQRFILLDAYWLNGRYQVDVELLANSYRWYPVLTNKFHKQSRQLKTLKQELMDEYKYASNDFSEELSFSQWCDLNYVLPAWCRLLQRIAQLHGKTLVNPYLDIDAAKLVVLKKEMDREKTIFNLSDVSINNVFDAMQRLLYNGEQSTKKLFNLAPPATSKLVKRSNTAPRRTEQACIQMLTLDYLVRFRSIQIN